MHPVGINEPGKNMLMMGNEAIARGAIEGGVDFCAAYPGTPSSDILETLAKVAKDFGIYVEWSVNEMVALESAGAAAFTGLRALAAMKQQGVNVCSDFLFTAAYAGTKGGFVLVACDDPAAHSSTQEQDSRNFARFAEVPLLEPATFQEAKEMTKWAFELSEGLKSLCMMRSVTRISHARGNVQLGELKRARRTASIGPYDIYSTYPVLSQHAAMHKKIDRAKKIFETSQFNWYAGPKDASFVIITSGTGWLYSHEAVNILGLGDRVGILKLGTTWPLPENLVLSHLSHAESLLFVEEIDPFLEQNIKILSAEKIGRKINFYGKESKHIQGYFGAGIGEINIDIVVNALAKLLKVDYAPRGKEYVSSAQKLVKAYVPNRELAFCAGCPHKASYWAIKTALKLDGRDGFVAGDIGCYSLGVGPCGFAVAKTIHCMGAGIGVANGLGHLRPYGLNRPVIALSGDSTFFHACIPALINARYTKSNLLYVIFDNSATSMTGFQPHPGTGYNALGEPAPKVSIEEVCRAIGVEVRICDPFEIKKAVATLCEMMQGEGAKVLIFRRTCALIAGRGRKKPRVYVEQSRCIGDECGCNRFCSRVFSCPGNIWDAEAKKAKIDDVICSGCGVCAQLCPRGAIVVEEAKE